MNTELNKQQVEKAIQLILETLGDADTQAQKQGLEAFHNGDSALIKRLSLLNLSDNYLKCLGYLVSAAKLTPNTDTILAESARAASNHAADKAQRQLDQYLQNLFGE